MTNLKDLILDSAHIRLTDPTSASNQHRPLQPLEPRCFTDQPIPQHNSVKKPNSPLVSITSLVHQSWSPYAVVRASAARAMNLRASASSPRYPVYWT